MTAHWTHHVVIMLKLIGLDLSEEVQGAFHSKSRHLDNISLESLACSKAKSTAGMKSRCGSRALRCLLLSVSTTRLLIPAFVVQLIISCFLSAFALFCM